jgi:hypothetical protein
VPELVELSLNLLRGKSGLQRVKCQLTTGGRESTASATENIPPFMVRVKRQGKSLPPN